MAITFEMKLRCKRCLLDAFARRFVPKVLVDEDLKDLVSAASACVTHSSWTCVLLPALFHFHLFTTGYIQVIT